MKKQNIRGTLKPMCWLVLIAASSAAMFAQLAAPNASGISYGHIHMFVDDPDAQKKIWVDLLGARPTNTGTLQLMSVPGAMVIASKGRTPPTGGSDGSTVPYISFRVKSYADTKAKLATANVTLLKDDPKAKQLLAEFPEKVRFEFVEDASLKTPLAFHHVEIASMNPESLRAWYVKTFSGTAGKRGQALTAMFPGGEIDIVKASAPGAPTKGRALDHIGFEIQGLEAFCKKLEADGMAFDLTYREMPQLGGLRISYIIDPEGTRIELTEGFRGR
jgi:catechol 2,3-dioxygenase-like lactoylglutathione lyase family enzyme